jgi:cobyrinic acid a,c-diamide synthase
MIQNASFNGPRGLVIAAPNSNTGKTVFTMGLVRALISRQVDVEVAKAGPGFIDPQYLARAAGRPCHNLDKWALGAVQLHARARALADGHDLLVIEGMMGMFDGAASTAGSTADLAGTLDLPVLLVVDASGLAQSIAALVHGYATLRQRPRLCGVITTQVGSPGHAEMLREALIEIGIPMLGALMRSDELEIPSRHLGLVQASERDQTSDLIDAARDAVLEGVDLEAILAAARPLGSVQPPVRLPPLGSASPSRRMKLSNLRIRTCWKIGRSRGLRLCRFLRFLAKVRGLIVMPFSSPEDIQSFMQENWLNKLDSLRACRRPWSAAR